CFLFYISKFCRFLFSSFFLSF
ncbi:putative membrane protein, partial [Chlamydia psittaci 01DC11]